MGGVPSKTLWKLFFLFLGFLFFQCFSGFGHFQPSAPFCTLAIRCLHAFKLAGTNRLTTAAMNMLGLRIKTACSNFEMFGHVLDNNLSFMPSWSPAIRLATLLVALIHSRCWALLCIAVDIHCLSCVRALIVLLCQVHDHELVAVQAHFVQGSCEIL